VSENIHPSLDLSLNRIPRDRFNFSPYESFSIRCQVADSPRRGRIAHRPYGESPADHRFSLSLSFSLSVSLRVLFHPSTLLASRMCTCRRTDGGIVSHGNFRQFARRLDVPRLRLRRRAKVAHARCRNTFSACSETGRGARVGFSKPFGKRGLSSPDGEPERNFSSARYKAL